MVAGFGGQIRKISSHWALFERLRETPYDVSHQLRTITGGELRRVQDHIMLRDTSASNAGGRLMWRLVPDMRPASILL
jgi:hypothetical protein